MDKNTKQYIANKVFKRWEKDNKEMLDDYMELAGEILFFHAKWGIEIGFVFHNPKEIGGRKLKSK